MLARFLPDKFTLALVTTVAIASFVPARGEFAAGFGAATDVAIALLFFLHGARLSRQAIIEGAVHWRLHLVVFASTFLIFPLLGLAVGAVAPYLLTPTLYAGILFLCTLPSTVQSSIAFTSVAGGNVAAAICSASASNILGLLLTPVLVRILLAAQGGGATLDAVEGILLQLLVPFAIGHVVQPLIGEWARRHRLLLSFVDRGSILMVVYAAFSQAVVGGLWHKLSPEALAGLVLVDAALLAAVLAITTGASRVLGFSREDEITIVFCGSKKSLASGVPMAKVIFAGQDVGAIVLPLMLYHQIQLMACAAIARQYAAARVRRSVPGGSQEASPGLGAAVRPADARRTAPAPPASRP